MDLWDKLMADVTGSTEQRIACSLKLMNSYFWTLSLIFSDSGWSRVTETSESETTFGVGYCISWSS